MTYSKSQIEEKIIFYQGLLERYSKNEKDKTRLETTRNLLEFWKAQQRKLTT